MPFELQIALRYLLARRRQAFISIISLVSTLGVAVGVHGARRRARADDRPAERAARSDSRLDRPHLRLQADGHSGLPRRDRRAAQDPARRRRGARDASGGPWRRRRRRRVHQLQGHRSGARGVGHGHREIDRVRKADRFGSARTRTTSTGFFSGRIWRRQLASASATRSPC